MCAVSQIVQYMEDLVPMNYWNNWRLTQFKNTLNRLKDLDSDLESSDIHVPDCDDEKADAYIKKVKEQLEFKV